MSFLRKSSSSTESGSRHHRMKSMKRGTVHWEQLVRPFCCNLAFRCLQRKRSLSRETFESWSGHAAVLFVDLSGYSKITSVLADRGAYFLSSIVNNYLAELLRVVQLFGGDIIKFAGDAIIAVWETDSVETLQLCVLCAAQCVTQMQELTGDYPVEGTDGLSFRIHCGLCCGGLDSEVFNAPQSKNMQRLYHVVSGDPLVEIGNLVEFAQAGETCVSFECSEYLKDHAVLRNGGSFGKLLIEVHFTPSIEQQVDEHIKMIRDQRATLRVPALEEDFIHPSVLQQLQHGGIGVAQMRNLCILFIAQTSAGNAANWLMEVHEVLDNHRCPIVQIIDDDKGVHLVAAVNLHETVPEATKLALNACHELIFKQVGCTIGMAMGSTFCGVMGSPEIACQWDITGAPVVRAARLMQYAISEGLQIAIDQSVYDSAALSTMMTPFSCIFLKGTKKSVTVYTLSSSKNLTASMILENWAFAPLHDEQVRRLRDFLLSDKSRGAAIITGPALVGKKVVCQRAAGLASLVPILHVSDATSGLFQIGRTLSDWFLHYYNKDCCEEARAVKDHLDNRRWSRAYDQSILLIKAVIQTGYRGCVVVDRVHDLDQFSLSFIRDCLVRRKYGRKTTLDCQSSLYSLYSEDGADPRNGKFFFLCTHEPLYHFKSAQAIKEDLIRAHRDVEVPLLEVLEATKTELNNFVQRITDIESEDYWMDLNAKTSGYRAGYLSQRIRRLRIMSVDLCSQGKTPMTVISQELKHHIPNRMARRVKAVTVFQISADTAMRFGRVFDELPPSYQTFVEVVTIATRQCFYHVPLSAVTMAMYDLFVENENDNQDVFPTLIGIREMVELFILKVEGIGASKRVHLRCPGFTDVVSAIVTPAQLEDIASALLPRLVECDVKKNYVDYLAIAGLAGTLGDAVQQHAHWRLAYEQFLKDSMDMDEGTANRAKELIEEEIEIAGGEVDKVLGVSLNIESCRVNALDPIVERLKYYWAPITFGPMGHTLSAISRNCFREIMVSRDTRCKQKAEKLRANVKSGVARYIQEISIVESYLKSYDAGTNVKTLEKEINILNKLAMFSSTEVISSEKAVLFLDQLVPNHIEPRMNQIRKHVEMLRMEKMFPIVMKDADEAIRTSFSVMRQDSNNNDAIQDALVTLASFNWTPKKVPEDLPHFFYSTVAMIRYRVLRKLSAGELLLFRHDHVYEDFEAFLILAALLPQRDLPCTVGYDCL